MSTDTDYVITLTEQERKCMEMICADVKEWICNAVCNRARIAYEQCVEKEVKRRLDAGEPVGTKQEIIDELYDAFVAAGGHPTGPTGPGP